MLDMRVDVWRDRRLQYFKTDVLDAVAQWILMCIIIQEHKFNSVDVRV